MKINFKTGITITLLFLFLSGGACLQTHKVRSAQNRKEQIESRQKKSYNKARLKEVKRRYSMQTNATKEQMKEANQRAVEHNKNTLSRKEPFIKRIFKRKKPKK